MPSLAGAEAANDGGMWLLASRAGDYAILASGELLRDLTDLASSVDPV